MTLRIGVLGAARISGQAIVDPARATGDRLVAVAARDPARAKDFAAAHHVERVVGSYAELVADPEVDVVYNPLANAFHGPWNLAAVQAGRHVLTEKPFASNAAEARAVRDAAVAAGVTIVEGFHYVHHPVALRLRSLVESGSLGTLQRIETHFRMPAPPDSDPRWQLDLAGGATMDLGCYALHLHRFLGSSPAVVSARAGERAGHPGVDEWLEADLVHADGTTGLAHCHMASDFWQITCRVVGSRGEALAHNIVLPQQDDRITVTIDGRERVEHLGTRSTYTYQLEALGAHLRGEKPFPLDVDDAVATAELIDAAYAAAGLSPRPSRPL
ncbi:Gfo/Idh/MocA family protein [Pseudonocardia sp.]|jgi:predicted dehydrogenase|uniref:Gfo/Idh/MocA family protein n=1 Tax=Pseudonocardia sp. TaxID=60912 RepID=UPI003D10C823